uniref:Uncharacterized protein n=1 Tax=Setaria digitata TaxID=48799 RepID=A0A915PND3_9BILA
MNRQREVTRQGGKHGDAEKESIVITVRARYHADTPKVRQRARSQQQYAAANRSIAGDFRDRLIK